jgi:hypothetical protein
MFIQFKEHPFEFTALVLLLFFFSYESFGLQVSMEDGSL